MTTALKIIEDESNQLQSTQILYTINIYNKNDALTQRDWAGFQKDVKIIVASEDTTLIHGVWYSSQVLDYQSMSISFNLTGDFPEMASRLIRGCLIGLRDEYPGCTIQWTEAEVSYL